MRYRVIVHAQAKDDLRRNANWWADHHSIEQALHWIDSVEEQLQELVTMPERHGLSLECRNFPYEIRDQFVGLGSRRSYRAIFTIQGDPVHVLTVKRGSEDTINPDDVGFMPEQ